MHGAPRTDNIGAVRGANTLVAKANTKNRDGRAKATHNIGRDSRLSRGTWPWRENNVARSERFDLGQGDLIVTTDDDLATQLAHVPREVVNEGVVVIDDEDHYSFQWPVASGQWLVAVRSGENPLAPRVLR
jgi:hypothetical protein